jgi:hypothetical protein
MSLPYTRNSVRVGADIYYATEVGVTGTETVTAGTQYFVPFRFDNKCQINKVGFECTATVASAVARLGIYKDAGLYFPRPAELIAEATGTVAASAAAFNEGDFTSAVISKPGLYWLSFAMQTANGTIRTSSGVRQAGVLLPLTTTEPAAQLVGCGYTQTSITSALASVSASATLTGVGEVPWLYFQVN